MMQTMMQAIMLVQTMMQMTMQATMLMQVMGDGVVCDNINHCKQKVPMGHDMQQKEPKA
jgi:hypothetical protein